uniref:Uncharacterized protein n=1 Tax=Salmonella sp. TaxID=599 RepID=A0A482ETV8_SALSP|nr:hypothetical protein NNIBIDOC_00157 [Salmonella sp.]
MQPEKNILAVGDNRTTRKRIAYTNDSLSAYRKPYSRRYSCLRMCTVTRQCDWETWHIYNNWLTVNGEPGERFQLPVAAEILRDQNKKRCRWWLLRSFFTSRLSSLLSSLCYFVIQTEVKFRNFFCVLNSFKINLLSNTIIQWVIKMFSK